MQKYHDFIKKTQNISPFRAETLIWMFIIVKQIVNQANYNIKFIKLQISQMSQIVIDRNVIFVVQMITDILLTLIFYNNKIQLLLAAISKNVTIQAFMLKKGISPPPEYYFAIVFGTLYVSMILTGNFTKIFSCLLSAVFQTLWMIASRYVWYRYRNEKRSELEMPEFFK